MMRTAIVGVTLAQAGAETLPGWPGTVIQFGSFGALCFVLWWLLTKYIPTKDEAQKQSLKELGDAQKQALEKQGETFSDSLTEILADSKAQRDAMTKAFDALRDEIRLK